METSTAGGPSADGNGVSTVPSVNEHQGAVGEYVRLRRRAATLSPDELAARAGVATTTVARLEAGLGVALASLVRVLNVLEYAETACSAPRPESVLLSQVPRQRTGPLGARRRDPDPAGI